MGFGFFKSTSPSSLDDARSPSFQDNVVSGDFVSREIVNEIVSLAAAGKFETAIKRAEGVSLSGIIPSLKEIQAIFQDDLEKSVSLSVNINESSTYGAKLNRISNDINNRAQGMAAAIEELSASSGSILSSSQNASHLAEQMIGNVREGISASHALQQANSDIEAVVSTTGVKVGELVRSTEEIHRILRMISEISEKTKLLSLNATIEAARAGEAGKGFAVVASEVKSLAEQTATSADDIKKKVESLTSVTQEISQLMTGVSSAVSTGREKLEANQRAVSNIRSDSEQVSEQMRDILSILKDQDIAVSEISSNVSTIADLTSDSVSLIVSTLQSIDMAESVLISMLSHFPSYELSHTTVNLAKSDHVIWKKRLACMAAGRTSIDPSTLADHKTCRLGKWYYSEASTPYKNLPAFRDIEQSHIDVHKHGILAAQKYNAADLDGALKEIDLVEAASAEVLRYLGDLSKKA